MTDIWEKIARQRVRAQGYRDGIANHQAWELAKIFDDDADTMEKMLAVVEAAEKMFSPQGVYPHPWDECEAVRQALTVLTGQETE